MKRILLFTLLFVSLSAMADERGENRLDRIAKHYSSMGSYSVSFTLSVGGGVQRGEMVVSGENSYMKVGDVEVFVEGSLRYEVRASSKEIILDKTSLYEGELLNNTNGFANLKADYNVEECEVGGAVAVRLTPKKSGATMYIITGSDGESISKVQYISGDDKGEMVVERCQKGGGSLPTFSKDRYKGFELIDFR